MPKTQHRSIRVTDPRWERLLAETREHGTTVADITNDFYSWWLREPHAKLPKRPAGVEQ